MVHLNIYDIYNQSQRLEQRHSSLVHMFKGYAEPNKKIHDLLKKGDLISVSKGYYLLSYEKLKKPYSPEVISNSLYGPSYVSLERALSIYQLIPEGVMQVTCVTAKRKKTFATPIGFFCYDHLIASKFFIGITQRRMNAENHYLIASPAKALMDYLSFRPVSEKNFMSELSIAEFLDDDLRLNLEYFLEMTTKDELLQLKKVYNSNIKHQNLLKHLLKKI